MMDARQLLFHSSLNEARVKQRITEGGYRVPPEKIHARIPRTTQLIKTALPIFNEARVLGNFSKNDPFRQIIVMKYGNYEKHIHVGKTMLGWRKDNIVLCGVHDVRGQKCLLQK